MKRSRTHKRFEQHDAERPHVDATVNLRASHRDLGRHVRRRRRSRALHGLGAQRVKADEFGHAEVDDLRLFDCARLADSARGTHKHVCRLEIAVKNALTMRVADGPANQHQHANARGQRVAMPMTPRVKRGAFDELHYEKRRTITGSSCVENVCDVRMFKASERGLLRFKTPHAVGAERRDSEDLDRDGAHHRVELFAQPHDAKRALTNGAIQTNTTDPRHWAQSAVVRRSE